MVSCTAVEGHRARLSKKTGLFAIAESDFPRLVEEANFKYFQELVYGWKEVVGSSHFNLERVGRAPDVGEQGTQDGIGEKTGHNRTDAD